MWYIKVCVESPSSHDSYQGALELDTSVLKMKTVHKEHLGAAAP